MSAPPELFLFNSNRLSSIVTFVVDSCVLSPNTSKFALMITLPVPFGVMLISSFVTSDISALPDSFKLDNDEPPSSV